MSLLGVVSPLLAMAVGVIDTTAPPARVQDIARNRIEAAYCGRDHTTLPPDVEVNFLNPDIVDPKPGYVGRLEWPGFEHIPGLRGAFWYLSDSDTAGVAIWLEPCIVRFAANGDQLLPYFDPVRQLDDGSILEVAYILVGIHELQRAVFGGPYYNSAVEAREVSSTERPFYGCHPVETPAQAELRATEDMDFFAGEVFFSPRVRRSKLLEIEFICQYDDPGGSLRVHNVQIDPLKKQARVSTTRTGWKIKDGRLVKETFPFYRD